MKSFAVLAFAAAAMAQSLSDLPACGRTCIGNMITIASSEFGCGAGDVVCYCTKEDFGFGVRDCASQACSSSDVASVVAFGTSYCQNALASAGTTGAAVAPLTSALASLTTDGPSAITTSALVATITSDGSTFETTTGFSTIYSSVAGEASSAVSSIAGDASSALSSIDAAASSASESLASVAASVSGSLANVASSVAASISGARSSAAGAASSVASSLAGAASSLAGEATGTASTGGAAPIMTGLPFAGAAGMAAWLLL